MREILCDNCGFRLEEDFYFCPGCGTDLKKERTCKKCGTSNAPNSKFCQNCGSKLVRKTPEPFIFIKAKDIDATTELTETKIPSSGITIEFRFSSSPGFEFAVEEARKHSSFKQFGEDKKAVYRVTYNREEMANAVILTEHLKGMRGRAVYVDGIKTIWESVFLFVPCYSKKLASYKPELYCYGFEEEWRRNICGCLNSRLNFIGRADWLSCGKFVDAIGTWKFDKDRIRHEIEKYLHPYRFCPALDEVKVRDAIDALPDEVNPIKNKNWKFEEAWGEEEDSGFSMTVERYGEKQKVVMKGVYPSGRGAVEEIASKTNNKLLLEVYS